MLKNNSVSEKISGKEFGKPTSVGAIIFALITLFNPNVNVVDFLPDFIGFFILARVFEKAADCAPYFEEARVDFLKLGMLSLMKIPAMFIIVFARSKNTFDNDIIVLSTLIFSIAEILLTIIAIQHLFTALTYLGNRSTAESLIKSNVSTSTERIKSLTYIFLIAKSVFCFLPESLRLTRSIQSTTGVLLITGSNYYAPTILLTLAATLVLGIAWLTQTIRYVKRIKAEGNFDSALISLASASAESSYLKRRQKRNRSRAFNTLFIASIFTFRIVVGNHYGINIIPPFIFGAVFLLAVILISKYIYGASKLKKATYVICSAYIPLSCAAYVLNVRFLRNYGYNMLFDNINVEAFSLYRTLIVFSAAELCMFLASMCCFALLMRRYITANLGLRPDDENYSRQDADYHSTLIKKTVTFAVIGALTAITKFVDVCLHFNMQLIVTDPNDITKPTMLVPSLPWFNTVVFLCATVFALYSFYYANLIKQEHNPQ